MQVLAGLGDALIPGGPAAYTQAALICSLQLGFCAALLWRVPGNDRLDNLVTAGQFGMEGVQTLLLLGASAAETAGLAYATAQRIASVQRWAFYFGVLALFLPVLMKGYDLLVICLWRPCVTKEGGFSVAQGCFAFWALLTTLPLFVLSLMGFESPTFDDDKADTLMTSAEEAGGIVEEVRADSCLQTHRMSI